MIQYDIRTEGKVKEYGEGESDLNNCFPSHFERERICVVDNKNNQFMSVFYHIRNAFAHGRFYLQNCNGNKVFVMEDVASKRDSKKSITARMIIQKKTLLKWIDLIKGGEKIYSKGSVK